MQDKLKDKKDSFKELIDSSQNAAIVATENGFGVFGDTSSVLTLFTMLIKTFLENKVCTKERLVECIDLATMEYSGLLQEMSKLLKELSGKLKSEEE
jgi:hypothetical protein